MYVGGVGGSPSAALSREVDGSQRENQSIFGRVLELPH